MLLYIFVFASPVKQGVAILIVQAVILSLLVIDLLHQTDSQFAVKLIHIFGIYHITNNVDQLLTHDLRSNLLVLKIKVLDCRVDLKKDLLAKTSYHRQICK